MTDLPNDSDDRDAALEFIRANAIPKLLAAVTREPFTPGPRIDTFVAAEIARLPVEGQERIIAAFERGSTWASARRQERAMQRGAEKVLKAAIPGIEALVKLAVDAITKRMK